LSFFIGSALAPAGAEVGAKGVLLLDLSTEYHEQSQQNSVYSFLGNDSKNIPGLYDVIRMIHFAKTDSSIQGIYIKANTNANGIAASEELRQALLDFKERKKFVVAYGTAISEGAYYVANAADKIYCNPNGGVEWNGFAANLYFCKKDCLISLAYSPKFFMTENLKAPLSLFVQIK